MLIGLSNLKGAMNLLGPIVSKKSTLPILHCLRIEYAKDLSPSDVKITATNLENTISIKIPVQDAKDSGVYIIEYEKLNKIISVSDADVMHFDFKSTHVVISSGFSQFNIPYEGKDEEFPKRIPLKDPEEIVFEDNIFKKHYGIISEFIGSDELGASLTHIFIDLEKKTMFATDRHKMGLIMINPKQTSKKELIIPNAFAKAISKIPAVGENTSFTILSDGINYEVDYGSINISSRVPETSFLKSYAAIVPKKKDAIVFSIKKPDLVSAIQKAKIANRLVLIKQGEESSIVFTTEDDIGTKVKSVVENTYENPVPINTLYVNGDFLVSILKMFSSDEEILFYNHNNHMTRIEGSQTKGSFAVLAGLVHNQEKVRT